MLCWGPFGLALVTLASCSDRAGNVVEPVRVSGAPAFTYDGTGTGCGPISDTCHDRPLTSEEAQRTINAIAARYHNGSNDSECEWIINLAFERIYSGNAKYWVDPPAGYYGDAHRTVDPQIIHVTALSFSTDDNVARAMIHEAAHLRGFNHPTAYYMEDECR